MADPARARKALAVDGPLRGQVVAVPPSGAILFRSEEPLLASGPMPEASPAQEPGLYTTVKYGLGLGPRHHVSVLLLTSHSDQPDPEDVLDLLLSDAAKLASTRVASSPAADDG